jgi:hypothetical protein
MCPDIDYRKVGKFFVVIAILALLPSFVFAQKKSSSSGSSSKPAAAPAQKAAPQKAPAQATKPPANGTKPPVAGTRPPANGTKPPVAGTKPPVSATKPPAPDTKPTVPPGAVHNANGTTTTTRPNGSSVTRDAHGKTSSVTTPGGAKANYNSAGKVSSIHTSVMDAKNPMHSGDLTISKGAHNQRSLVTTRKDGTRVVGLGAHRGFVEHTFTRNGRTYMRRTYVVNGRATAYVYRGYPYRGRVYYGYVPAYYYGPGYYGWVYDPWGAPVPYAWGWAGDPWYGYYGGYFAVAPVYGGASLWLTDYVIAQNLQAAYQAQADANGGAPPPADSGEQSGYAGGAGAGQNAAAITPEVKKQIDDEVKAQIEAEKQAASQTAGSAQSASGGGDQVPAALDPNYRTFIVSAALQENLDGAATCGLSPGDVLTRIDDAPDANQNVKVLVTTSQRGDCATGAQVAVGVQDLQDMHNDFAAKIDGGLQKLADSQGKNGIPGGPAAGGQKNPDGTASADLTALADLQDQQKAADQTEADVKQAEGSGQGDD